MSGLKMWPSVYPLKLSKNPANVSPFAGDMAILNFDDPVSARKNEMNRALGHVFTHTG